MDLTFLQSLVGSISAYLIGLAKSGVPGAAMVTIPLMADQFGAKASVGLILPTLITGDICALIYYRRHARWPIILRVLPLTVVGIVIGWYLLGLVNDSLLRQVIGILVLVLLGLRYLLSRSKIGGGELAVTLGPGIGILAGVTTTLANAAGPLMTVYLLWTGVKKEQFVGSAAWFFFTVNCIKVPFFIQRDLISTQSLQLNLLAVPLVIIGAISGILLLKRINQRTFERVVQVLIAAAALKLLLGP
ncbi:MAG: TSUP family transporter [Chitinivibrionales bacterium]|nr:TSUP family transporter [Chitinivibrionales bacterium]